VQALAFKRVVDGPHWPVTDDDDIRKADASKEWADDIEIGVGLGFLSVM
jgi:hypothetical protein